jgi:precorrin-2 dehydrogenase/sirohydrochlorin ferrochelatase
LELAAEGLILLEKEFSERFLDESPWVFLAARLDKSLTAVAELAREKGLWLNVASSPTDSSFFLPALARDEPFRLAVSTGGASPALAARVARDLKATYHGYGAFCRLLARVRALVLAADLGEGARREILTALADDAELSALVAQAELGQAALLRERLESLMAPVSLPADFPL